MATVRPFSYNPITSDWFMPSRDELEQMYINLYQQGVGSFSGHSGNWEYSTSTQSVGTDIGAYYIQFTTGTNTIYDKASSMNVRAARTFTGPDGAYSLRDVGPAGGLIFYISGTTYWEAAPNDTSYGPWCNTEIRTTNITGAQGQTIGTGQSNTTAIIGTSGHTSSLAEICDNLTSGTTISDTDQVGDLAIAYTGTTNRFDLGYGDVTWYMGADEDPGHVIAYRVPWTNKPEFWRTDSKTDALFLNLSNYIRRINGDGQTFSDTSSAYTWLTANGYWTPYSGQSTQIAHKFTIDTQIAGGTSLADEFYLPVSASTGTYYVDWGDGSGEETFTTSGLKTHTYTTKGEYQISVRGDVTSIVHRYHDYKKIRSIDQWGSIQWTNMASMFWYTDNMTGYTYTDSPDLSNCSSMSGMFAYSRFNGSVNDWDVSNVDNFSSMFYSDLYFNQPLNNWNTSGATVMAFMFAYASSFNQDVDNFDVSKCANLSYFFASTGFNYPLPSWDTRSATNMQYMFYNNDQFNHALTGATWIMTGVTNVHAMFHQMTKFNASLSTWDTRNVSDWSSMFLSSPAFNQPVNHFDVRKGTDFHEVFDYATSFNQPLDNWVFTGQSSNYKDFLANATNFNSAIGANWQFTKPNTYLDTFFFNCLAFNQPVSGWTTTGVISCLSMFYGCDVFNQSLAGWDTSNVTDMRQMFMYTDDFNGDISGFDTSSVNTFRMQEMFSNALSFNQPVSHFDVSGVNSLASMFREAASFNQSVSSWDTRNVQTFINMFYNCPAFKRSLSTFIITGVTHDSTGLSEICGGTTDLDSSGSSNYDSTISSWADQNPSTGLTTSFGNSVFTSNVRTAGTTTGSVSSFQLVSSGHSFTFGEAVVGDIVQNTVTNGWATVDSIVSDTVLDLSHDIFQDVNVYYYIFTPSGSVAEKYETLVNTYYWTINDGGFI